MFRSESAASAGLVAGGAGSPIASARITRSTKAGLGAAGRDVGASVRGDVSDMSESKVFALASRWVIDDRLNSFSAVAGTEEWS